MRPARRRSLVLLASLILLAPPLRAHADEPSLTASLGEGGWWAVGAQLTTVGQTHTGVGGAYFNPLLSFGPEVTPGWSLVITPGLALRPTSSTAIVFMPEYANGRGMPRASGLGGYPNGDIVRVPALGNTPYVARAFVRQEIALSSAMVDADEATFESRTLPVSVLANKPQRAAWRLELTAGKFAMNDFFDVSEVGGDTRHGFMNWSLWEMGAWDYAADTRGYTLGLVVALEAPHFAVRAAVALMPAVANGTDLDFDVVKHRSEMLEVEGRYKLFGQKGRAKALFFMNHAHMGNYARALADGAARGVAPDIVSTRQEGAVKVGGGLLVEQDFGAAVSGFLRLSINSGETETFAFTEIDRAVAFGAVFSGKTWKRPFDRLGFAMAFNGLSDVHARYLAAGGVGFQLGDGALRYAPEVVAEAYYLASLWRFVELSLDVQGIWNPGFNRDRGPTAVVGARLHAHF